MMQRRDVLKGIAGLASVALNPRIALAAPARVRVTLVRWPYT
ncbi:MAG TPA: hypothetical protein PKU70_11365 [Vicinamibacteria bacterium]|nr:hypothetical protein [Vicinamibacteria bacterium]HRB13602.1 hypothetical protein [Vicinamibacteria bacterium]